MGEILRFRFEPKIQPRVHDFVTYHDRQALILGIDPTLNGGIASVYMLDSKNIMPVAYIHCHLARLCVISAGLIGLVSITPHHYGKTVVEEGYWDNILHVKLFDGRNERESSYISIRELQFASPFWPQSQLVSKGT